MPKTSDGNDDSKDFLMEVDQAHEAWSPALAEHFGRACAVTFAVGSDVLGDQIADDLRELAKRPRGTHVGELSASWLDGSLPEQFAMRYDYDLMFALGTAVQQLRDRFRVGDWLAYTVLEEIALYLIFSRADDFSDMSPDLFADDQDDWRDWLGDILQDLDVEQMLFTSGRAITPRMIYHFDFWLEPQFHGANATGDEYAAEQLGLLRDDTVGGNEPADDPTSPPRPSA